MSVPVPELFRDILNVPGNFVLEGNKEIVEYLKEHVSDFVESKSEDIVGNISIWHLPGSQFGRHPCVKVFPTGHLAFYDSV